MLRSNNKKRITLIDFGNAIKENEIYYYLAKNHTDVQSLYYRAPEVIFGLPFGQGTINKFTKFSK